MRLNFSALSRFSLFAVLLTTLIFIGKITLAEIPKLINYQGVLLDRSTGDPLPDGECNISFTIYDDQTAGSMLWSEAKKVTASDGLFNTLLGDTSTLDLNFNIQYYMELAVEGDILSPRSPMTSVGSAINADLLDGHDYSELETRMDNIWDESCGKSVSCSGAWFNVTNSGIGTTLSVKGGDPAIYGSAYVYAIRGDADYYGVYGYAAFDYGVYGSAKYYGVYGSAINCGVYGKAWEKGVYGSASTYGVYGLAVKDYGVYGKASSYGVYGSAVNDYGVYGSAGTYGVYGKALSYGVYGLSSSFYGVYGSANSSGVYGKASYCCGVYGEAPSYGVFGKASNGFGVYGLAGTSYGVFGSANDDYGVFGSATDDYGVYGNASSYGVYGSASTGIAIYAKGSGGGATNPAFKSIATATNGIAGCFENSSTSASDVVVLITHGGTGDLLRCDKGNPWNVRFKVSNAGYVTADGSYTSPASDFAELMTVVGNKDKYEPGDVLVLSGSGIGVELSTAPYATNITGIYSTNPGFVGGGSGAEEKDDTYSNKIPVAIIGIVPCKVTASNGSIKPGDLLTSSEIPGHAMKAIQKDILYGSVVGKAMGELSKGEGVIDVLVSLQ